MAIIGAGMSGILAAHRLQQAGVDCVVLEKNRDVGGTWLENTYPGCRVDVFNHVYSYSGEQRPDWPEYHSSQPVLLDYFRDCARRWGIGNRIRFGTTVESLAWDEEARRWNVRLRTADDGTGDGPDAATETISVGAVVSAVGQLNRPLMPHIEGTDDFAGEKFHSSVWRHDIDWSGRRVAVIGTGASALQFIPHLAQEAAHVTVFQRTPPWLIPRPVYHEPLAEGLLKLFEIVPGYAHWFRLRLFWCTHEGTVGALRRDPAWTGPLEVAVSPRNDEARRLLTLYLESQFGDRPDLLAKVVPRYPVGSKRVVLDNGIWASTLKRPNVELVSDGIERIEAHGVRGSDGQLHAADVIVFGTGFRASEFLMPMRVMGRGGADLHTTWNGDARAYNGVCVPGFPNLFCIYGPNTNIVGQRQHHLLRRVRYPLRGGVPAPAGPTRRGGHGLPARRLRPLLRADGRAQLADGMGHISGQQLVQEPQRPDCPELAPAADRLLAPDPPPRPGRLRAALATPADFELL